MKKQSTKQLLKQVLKDKTVAIVVLFIAVILLVTGVIDDKLFKDIIMFLLI
jgi:hypothetical protein